MKGAKFWGRRASFCLFRKWHCCEATTQVFQDMIGRGEDNLLKAIAGLSGGIVSSGSTCGVVSGGALGLALLHEKSLGESNVEAEKAILSLAGEYVKWFQDTYNTTLCRELINVNAWSLGGFLRLLVPGDKILKCLLQISKAMQYLYTKRGQDFPLATHEASEGGRRPIHCAQEVLRRVREETSIGDSLLERLSIVLDGGVGLQGGGCAALAASVMDINLLLGSNLRNTPFIGAVKAFFVGHRNLRANKIDKFTEPYGASKGIVQRFKKEAGSLECIAITGRSFSDYESFQDHISSSEKCKRLIDLSVEETIQTIEKY